MQHINFEGATHKLGPPKAWDAEKDGPCGDLYVQIDDGICKSVWQPSEAEIDMLRLGARIVLHVWGGQPPVAVVTEFITESRSAEKHEKEASEPVRQSGEAETDAGATPEAPRNHETDA